MNEKGKMFTERGYNAMMDMVKRALTIAKQAATKDELTAAKNELFTSVSDGKSLIASAITDKGVFTAADASFQTMREHILAIETGGGVITMEGLTIATPPDKVDYYVNDLYQEYFDPTGMTFILHVDLVGMKLALPVCPSYEAEETGGYRMRCTVRPEAPEGMSNWPEVELELSPDRPVQAGDTQITASVSWRGQKVQTVQGINVAIEYHWQDFEANNLTWADMAERFPTWGDLEGVSAVEESA